MRSPQGRPSARLPVFERQPPCQRLPRPAIAAQCSAAVHCAAMLQCVVPCCTAATNTARRRPGAVREACSAQRRAVRLPTHAASARHRTYRRRTVAQRRRQQRRRHACGCWRCRRCWHAAQARAAGRVLDTQSAGWAGALAGAGITISLLHTVERVSLPRVNLPFSASLPRVGCTGWCRSTGNVWPTPPKQCATI